MRPDVEKRKDNIGLLVFLCIFVPVAGLMYAAQERYPKDNKLRVRRIYSEINEMIRPHTVFRDWSSTRAGTSSVKFTVKGKPEDLEGLSANFLKRSEHFHFLSGLSGRGSVALPSRSLFRRKLSGDYLDISV